MTHHPKYFEALAQARRIVNFLDRHLELPLTPETRIDLADKLIAAAHDVRNACQLPPTPTPKETKP